jgi:hypothetical protein
VVTEYVPLLLTTIELPVAPVDQAYVSAVEHVNRTESPKQNVVAPSALITGVGANGITVKTKGDDG